MSIIIPPYTGTYQLAIQLFGAIPTPYQFEQTHPQVATAFTNNMSVIYEIFSRPVNSDGTSTPPITAADANNVFTALDNLKTLAQGTVITSGTGVQQLYYCTKEMLQSFDVVFRSFQAATPFSFINSGSLDASAVKLWKDFSLVTPAIQEALSLAMRAASLNRSIQAMIEMEYVAAGNDLIENKLTDLESAISTTKDVLDLLANIQNAKNNVTTITRSQRSEPLVYNYDEATGSTELSNNLIFEFNYQSQNSAFYKAPQFPIPPDTLITYYNQVPRTNYIDASRVVTLDERPLEQDLYPLDVKASGAALFANILSYKRQLSAFLPRLSALLKEDRLEPNSLYNRVKTVLDNMKTMFVGGRFFEGNVSTGQTPIQAENITNGGDKALALYRWLADNTAINYDVKLITNPLSTGDVQSNLSSSITSATGLNDTQKEAVRNFMFVFEEFYKSASAALQRISQMIEKMAGNISR
jgi:hypothetical protein